MKRNRWHTQIGKYEKDWISSTAISIIWQTIESYKKKWSAHKWIQLVAFQSPKLDGDQLSELKQKQAVGKLLIGGT